MNTLRASLKRYFLTGLLVITPIWGTILILKTLFVSVDNILGTALADLVLPDYYFPGLGIMALVLLIFLKFFGKTDGESLGGVFGPCAHCPGDLCHIEIHDGYFIL